MQFKFHMGTKVFFGKNCVKENKSEFGKYGRKAAVITGRKSGAESGALDDVLEVLGDQDIDYILYDRIDNNPSLENVKEAGKAAGEFGAEFIIGIGGGSPLDAAKAAAVLAVNDMDPLELYSNKYENKPLPIIAIPTTAGTGSEVTPYSILTRKDITFKKSFGNDDIFPRASFLDARYTQSMSLEVTVNTAVDALSHAVEGYLSKRSTVMSDLFAVEAIGLFGKSIQSLTENKFDFEARERLLYMAMLAGMVIAHTGTTIVHPLGYALTYFREVPHGKANGLFMKEYLAFNYDCARERINRILELLELGNIEEFGKMMDRLLGNTLKLSGKELEDYASIVVEQKSVAFNVKSVDREDVVEIMRKSLIIL